MAKTKRRRTSIPQKRIIEHFKKSDCEIIVVRFKDGKRIGTYEGLNIFEALYDIAKGTAEGFDCFIVFHAPKRKMCSRDFKDWEPCIESAKILYDTFFKIYRR